MLCCVPYDSENSDYYLIRLETGPILYVTVKDELNILTCTYINTHTHTHTLVQLSINIDIVL